MRRVLCAAAAGWLVAGPLLRAADPLDSLDEHLSFSTADDAARVHLSGTLDLEEYGAQQPNAEILRTNDGEALFVPRLSAFLDGQVGSHLYVFMQARADRGFDPGYGGQPALRLDEYVVRFTPSGPGGLNFQIGKFATVVGNWTLRHGSWDNPFITAPLPYDTLTGVWDAVAARGVPTLLEWAHVVPFSAVDADADKTQRLPIIWGPSYAAGAAVFGEAGMLHYAAEVKNASLSARPETWSPTRRDWSNPTFSAHLGLQPDEAWNVGVSASTGPYLEASAAPTLPPGIGFGRYRETVLGQDVAYAWHHFQAWAELYEARFEIPAVTNADTAAYYLETRYKFTPQFSGGIRWNQQLYATVPVPATGAPGAVADPAHFQAWGRDLWRVDVAPEYRFTPTLQLKVQFSLEQSPPGATGARRTAASQLTLRW